MSSETVPAGRRAPRTKHQLRCFCGRRPLLAFYGLDAAGRLYVHVMVYKQRKIYGNIILRGGPVEIQCRECLRWHIMNFTPFNRIEMEETTPPTGVPLPPVFQQFTEEVTA